VRTILAVCTALLIALSALSALALNTSDVPRMTKQQLKPLLGKPDVVIIDVRQPGDWTSGKLKIKGAVREDVNAPVASWMSRYPKDKILIFYCS
jgi:rhodanese-related sulfurtransferase